MSKDSFLGRGWAFPVQFEPQGRGAALVEDELDIEQSLRILLSTNPGERVMQPKYGCGLKAMVFREMNNATMVEIKTLIKKAVLFFEPRIELESVDVEPKGDAREGHLKIVLNYRVISTNSRSNMVYPFYLQEGTLVDG